MKKFFFLCMLLVFALSAIAERMPIRTNDPTPDYSVNAVANTRPVARETRGWEWEIPPQPLLTNYADYFQAYSALPVALQPEEHGGGIYIVYRVKDQAGNSEVNYSYIHANGIVQSSAGLGEVGYYCDAEVDPETGNVFATWHAAVGSTPETVDCLVTYDLYHIIGGHGLWKDPVIQLIDSDDPPIPDPTEKDEFMWPEIKIGPSPVPDKQRVYVIASNANPSDGSAGYPSENPILCYADFDENDLSEQSDLEWTYRTIATFDSWNAEDPEWLRAFKAWTVIDSQLIFAGFRVSNVETEPYKLMCFVNDNYGEGEFVEYYQDMQIEEDNPTWIDPESGDTYYLYSDLDNSPTVPYEAVYQTMINSGRFNLYPAEDGDCVVWGGSLGILFDIDPDQLGLYRPLWYQIYPKVFRFDLNTLEFSFTDVYPAGAVPNDSIPMKPWDLDEDGIYDETYDDNMPMWANDWPIFYFDEESTFDYNQYYLTSNPETGVMAYVWVDGLNAKQANEGIAGFESWVAKTELAITISYDWGMTWNEPIFMNANPESDNYVEELEGMIPCFVYPGDRIERDPYSGESILHLFFLDDNDYGSFHSKQQGLNNGSTFQYAAVRFTFSDNDHNEIVNRNLSVSNYPNPFNPQTAIAFELDQPSHVKIDIYNIKGQKVKTFGREHYQAGPHKLTWNAQTAPSGVYFYRLTTATDSATGKMILLK
ncbi:MAG: T9SS type A sorting domain-containing protein [Candidatus Cloacimonetes bacterium]|nr:T9SS type A sorting domain-containing protein [Candidatus Cloacimonadota bacterium]